MKNKKALLVIMVLLVLILIACIGAYAYIALDVFKTPKQLFGKYLDNQIVQVKDINMGALKTVSENLKNTASETEYDMEVKSDYDDETMKFKLALKADPINSVAMATLKMNAEENELANYSLYADKEKIGLKIPEVNNKYFSVKINTILDETQKFLEEQNLTEKTIELNTENIEKYKNEFKDLYKKYLEEVKLNFTDDKFSAEKNIKVDVNGKNISANRYSFNINVAQLGNISVDILNKISDEPILSDFMNEEEISKFKEVITYIDEKIKSINEDTAENNKNLKFCVYESSGKTVKLEIQVDEEVIAEFMLEKISDNETNIIVNTIKNKKSDGDVGSKSTMIYSILVENENVTTVSTTVNNTYIKEDIEALKKSYEDSDLSYYSEDMIEERYKDETTTQKVTTTLNGDKATSKITLNQLEDLGYKFSKMQINYKFGTEVSFDDLNDAINLEDYKDDEEKLNELFAECMENLQNNPDTLLGSLVVSNINSDDESDDESYDSYSTLTADDYDKERIETLIKDALDDCLDSYKRDLEEDENTNISDYLTVEKVSEMILSSFVSDIEFIDGSTLKCNYYDEVYYVELVLNGDTLKVDEVTAYTEEEYESR